MIGVKYFWLEEPVLWVVTGEKANDDEALGVRGGDDTV